MDLLWRLVGPDGFPSGRVALLVDGPNVLRDEFDVDLDDIRAAGRSLGGWLSAAWLYLDEHATPGLVQAAKARGLEVVVTNGDVDVKFTVDLMRYVVGDRVNIIAVASRDTDLKSALETTNAYGLRTAATAPGSYGRSDVLQSTATHVITLNESAVDDN